MRPISGLAAREKEMLSADLAVPWRMIKRKEGKMVGGNWGRRKGNR
jgi:hypothetical protein